MIEFVRVVLEMTCLSSSDPSRGPSEYDGGHPVHTVLVKQEEMLRQLVYSITATERSEGPAATATIELYIPIQRNRYVTEK